MMPLLNWQKWDKNSDSWVFMFLMSYITCVRSLLVYEVHNMYMRYFAHFSPNPKVYTVCYDSTVVNDKTFKEIEIFIITTNLPTYPTPRLTKLSTYIVWHTATFCGWSDVAENINQIEIVMSHWYAFTMHLKRQLDTKWTWNVILWNLSMLCQEKRPHARNLTKVELPTVLKSLAQLVFYAPNYTMSFVTIFII